jgi:hypothetical protein
VQLLLLLLLRRLLLVGWLGPLLHNRHWYCWHWHTLRLLLLVHWTRLRLRLRLRPWLNHGLLHWHRHGCTRLRLLVYGLLLRYWCWHCHWHWLWLWHHRAWCWPAGRW